MYEDYFYFHVPEASYLRIKLYIGGSKNGNFTVYDSSGSNPSNVILLKLQEIKMLYCIVL